MKANENKKKITIRILVMSIFVIIIVAIVLNKGFDNVKAFIENHKALGAILSLIIYTIFGVAFLPTEPFTLFLAAIMGPFWTIILSTIGNTIACLIEYFIGQGVGGISNFEEKKESLPFNLGKLPINSVLLQIGGRLVPGFGPKVISVMSGVYKVSLFTFTWTSIVSNLIGGIILGFGGHSLGNLID